MKKNIFKILTLSAMTLLASCGASQIDAKLYIGGSSEKETSIVVKYTYQDVLEAGYKLKGTICPQKNAVLKDSYTFSYSFEKPKANSYTEYNLCTWTKSQLEATKSGDSYTELSFEIEFDIDKMFPKDSETKVTYFVLHASNWNRENILDYNCSEHPYTWNGSKVKLTEY